MKHPKIRTVSNYFVRLVWSCALIAGLAAGLTTTANAHEYAYKPRVNSNRVVYVDDRHAMPRWLRKNSNFKRWYKKNDHYHDARRVSWNRLYDLYRLDRRYYRYYSNVNHYSERSYDRDYCPIHGRYHRH